jgi:hypothetical protein
MEPTATRALTAMSAVGLFGIGLLFIFGLVANDQDNAYVGLWLIGGGLVVSGFPYLLAAALPSGSVRRRALVGAVAFSAFVGVLAFVILILSLVVIPTQDYAAESPVLRNHVLGLIVLTVMYAALYRLHVPALRRRAPAVG